MLEKFDPNSEMAPDSDFSGGLRDRYLAHYDLTQVSFDEFVDFIFHRQVPAEIAEGDSPGSWIRNFEIEYDIARNASYFIRLFKNPGFLFDKFSHEQLEQGFWIIPQSHQLGGVKEVIWNNWNRRLALSWEVREECIRSMFFLFERFFAVDALELSCHMWWDALCYSYRRPPRNAEDVRIQQVMFETLTQILALEARECQGAALHGLGHLRHPKTKEIIEAYLQRNPNLDENITNYARACIRGDIM